MDQTGVRGIPSPPRQGHLARPWISLRNGPPDHEDFQLSVLPENQAHSSVDSLLLRLGEAGEVESGEMDRCAGVLMERTAEEGDDAHCCKPVRFFSAARRAMPGEEAVRVYGAR